MVSTNERIISERPKPAGLVCDGRSCISSVGWMGFEVLEEALSEEGDETAMVNF